MIDALKEQIRRRETVFIDTNLFILLLTGLIDRRLVAKFKRTQHYNEQDFDILADMLESAKRVCVTTQVLTETDNLIRQLPDRHHAVVATIMRNLFDSWIEIYRPSKELLGAGDHMGFGLTDAILIQA